MPGMLHSLVVKVAERCNLNCTYCYMYNHEDKSFLHRPKFMSDDVFDQLLRRIHEYCRTYEQHSMTLCLHGGEPTLIGAGRMDRMIVRARNVLGDCLGDVLIQTNATLIDDEWVAVFKRNNILVGVSLDGPPQVNDAVRVDHQGGGSYARTLQGIKLLQEEELLQGILCVINPGESGLAVYKHFRSLGINQMNFLLPDASHDSKSRLYGPFGETPVADYLIPVFDEWFFENDASVKVRIFWDLVSLILGGRPGGDAFGNRPMSYLIIETDGSIEALDALRVCKEGIGTTALNVLSHGFNDLQFALPFVSQLMNEGIPLCQKCLRCPELSVCGGGYLPHRYSEANGFNNPSIWCQDILKVIAHIRSKVGHVAAA